MPDPFRFASALSTAADVGTALAECGDELAEQLGASSDLLVAFYKHDYGDDVDEIPAQLCERFEPQAFLGCTGESIVGNGREIESGPAISVWGAVLPGVSLTPMRLEFARTPDGPTITGWPESTAAAWPEGAALLAVGEPFSFPADWFLERLNSERPGVPVVGGMASGGQGPGRNRVALGAKSYTSGAAAVLVSGPIDVRTVVSQGCRPIGQPFVVTKADQQLIQELGGRPPLHYLHELFEQLSEQDRALVHQGLHVGCVINEYKDNFGRGDFLIRNCLGADQKTGAIAAGDYFRRGQTVQFHVRDAATADEDFRELLDATAATFQPQGALLFTCNGRGSRLFDTADHDAGALRALWPELPLAGFFAQGEMGPIGGKNFLHGFTASTALFAQRTS